MASTGNPSPGRGRSGRRGRGRGGRPGRGAIQQDSNNVNGNGRTSRNTSHRSDEKAPPAGSIDGPDVKRSDGKADGRVKIQKMTDEQVLIAFGVFVRGGDSNAVGIHQLYLANHMQRDFLNNAREFLIEQEDKDKTSEQVEEVVATHNDVSVQDSAISSTQVPSPAVIEPPPGLHHAVRQERDVASKQNQMQTTATDAPNAAPHTSLDRPQEKAPEPTTSNVSILPSHSAQPGTKLTSLVGSTQAKTAKLRRIQTRLNEQPGKIFANGVAAYQSNGKIASLTVRLRCELTARWVLPLKYLRERVLRRFQGGDTNKSEVSPQNLTIRDALKCLTVGLFRVGIPDNGAHSSIVSKEILASYDGSNESTERKQTDFPFDIDNATDSIYGSVPFYSPRTPGNVVFRLYFEDEPHIQLATGPIMHVAPDDSDYASVLRFILSNFKSKKTNGLSSIHSLASVLEQFSPPTGYPQSSGWLEEAGRAAWGCICETRKLVEQAASSYVKKKQQLEEQEAEQEEAERVRTELPQIALLDLSEGNPIVGGNDETSDNGVERNAPTDEKSKLASDKYTNERKWKEIQVSYSMILEAVLKNNSAHFLFKKDIMQKMRQEYELWCPLCESFAPNPLNAIDAEISQQPITFLSHSVKNGQTKLFVDSRQKMQKEVLGFVPKTDKVSWVGTKNSGKPALNNGRKFFHELSEAIESLYVDEYQVSEYINSRRERVRAGIEQVVSASGAFPEGTRVAVFGSSANGFGSPNSDLDLCLEVPQTASGFSKEENGVAAMTQLAQMFTEAGMSDVNTDRLTARIPIVKFNFHCNENGDDIVVECDLSLQNPLACLNTSLLNAYSKISPDTCILASIIKRWAKSRDINNPSMHTLSSYGYVLMLLYYLTSAEPTSDGYVVDLHINGYGTNPILANLQFVDPEWVKNPHSGPYREIISKPLNCIIQHPTEPNYLVNTYFYGAGVESLQQYYWAKRSSRPCLGVLLASFFRYFAYEFDYKKYVVSLNTKHGEAKEKELKAEEDGWSLFKQGLAIEDPFELFYDVAHVVKTSNSHRIQREFALAYSKIVTAACCNGGRVSGRELIDLICEPVAHN